MGGFGSAVLEAIHEAGLPADSVRTHGVADTFVEHSPQSLQRAAYKLDAAGVLEKVFELYPELERGTGKAASPAASDGRETPQETIHWT
jgi:deoxyxylulose-5-phosphate synthase